MLTESSFLYMDPKEPKNSFAQCGTCSMFTGSTCTIHGKGLVKPGWSCGLYVHGKPMKEMKGKEHKSVTPKESGLIKEPVRCENCDYFNSKTKECALFVELNDLPMFKLREKVHPKGCCNAFVTRQKNKKVKSINDLRQKAKEYSYGS